MDEHVLIIAANSTEAAIAKDIFQGITDNFFIVTPGQALMGLPVKKIIIFSTVLKTDKRARIMDWIDNVVKLRLTPNSDKTIHYI